MRAVVTAGGMVDGAFADAAGTRVKALASVGGRTMLDAVLDACAGAGIADVAVIGGGEVRAHADARGARTIDAAEDGKTNLLRALDAWPGERIVYLTSDIPFVTAEALRAFVARSAPFAVTMALAGADAYAQRFPGAPEHTVTLGGERVANGNAFTISPEAVPSTRDLATRFFAARKSLPRMAMLLGPMMCLRFAMRRLRIADLEAYAGQRLGVAVLGVRDCDPALCFDVDDLADLTYARAFAERSEA